MFRKLNTKTMLIALIVLLALVVGVNIIDRSNGDRTFKEYLVKAKPDDIDQIQLFPKSLKGKSIELKKNGEEWTISENGASFPADNNAIMGLIGSLNPLKAQSVVSSGADRWKTFDLTDSLSTRVKLMKGANVLADLLIGKFEMTSNQTAVSYARLVNDKVVYSVDGYLSLNVNRNMDSFRNRTVVEGNKSDWSKLSFTYPADSSFVLEKESEGKWHIGATSLDAANVDKFLDVLQNLAHSSFAAQLPPSTPIYTLKIEGSKLAQPIEVLGYMNGAGNLVVTSSQNKGNWFDGKELLVKVFPGKRQFLKK